MKTLLEKCWHYNRLQNRLTRLAAAAIAFGDTDRAFNLILRKQRLKGKFRGRHCYPVYRDFGAPGDILTEWRTEPKSPGNQILSLHYRTR